MYLDQKAEGVIEQDQSAMAIIVLGSKEPVLLHEGIVCGIMLLRPLLHHLSA